MRLSGVPAEYEEVMGVEVMVTVGGGTEGRGGSN